MPKAKTLLNKVTVDLARARARNLENAMLERGITPEQITIAKLGLSNGINHVLKTWTPSMRMPSSGVRGVLESGRFKNQFEVGDSNGDLNPSYRAELSDYYFGMPKDGIDYNREVYGYLRRPVSQGPDNVSHYGGYEINFKPSVKKRMTFTEDDSMMNFGVDPQLGGSESSPIVPFDEETYLNWIGGGSSRFATGVPRNRAHLTPSFVAKRSDPDFIINYPGYNYIEAQYHGGLTSDDIGGIDVHGNWDGKHPKTEAALKQFAIDRGLKIRSNGKCVWNCKDGK